MPTRQRMNRLYFLIITTFASISLAAGLGYWIPLRSESGAAGATTRAISYVNAMNAGASEVECWVSAHNLKTAIRDFCWMQELDELDCNAAYVWCEPLEKRSGLDCITNCALEQSSCLAMCQGGDLTCVNACSIGHMNCLAGCGGGA